MTTPSTRLKTFVSHHVTGPRLRRILLVAYRRARALRNAMRRVQGRSRRAVQHAGRGLLVATGRGKRDGAFVVVAPTGKQASSALIHSINTAVAAGVPVDVLLVEYDAELDVQFASNLERGAIPAEVTLRRFWRDAIPGAGLSKPRHDTAGLVAEPAPAAQAGEWRTAFYRSGIPVLAVDETTAGCTVDYFGSVGEPLRRDEIDADRKLVRIVDLHPDTGREVTHRYPIGDTCWLSVWVNENGTLGPVQQHLPAPREFTSLGALQAQWVDQVVSRTARPILIAANSESREVVRLVEHSGAIRRALAGEVSTAQWKALVTHGGGVESLRLLS
jgi:hypothetical protein